MIGKVRNSNFGGQNLDLLGGARVGRIVDFQEYRLIPSRRINGACPVALKKGLCEVWGHLRGVTDCTRYVTDCTRDVQASEYKKSSSYQLLKKLTEDSISQLLLWVLSSIHPFR